MDASGSLCPHSSCAAASRVGRASVCSIWPRRHVRHATTQPSRSGRSGQCSGWRRATAASASGSNFSASEAEVQARKNPELYEQTVAPLPTELGHESSRVSRTSRSARPPTTLIASGPKPEVLAPAGGWPQLKVAVAEGCDCVYFGVGSMFNARARAENFSEEELPEVMQYLHQRGVKGYATINTLVFEDEVLQIEQLLRTVARAGVDAIIVQDLGVAQLARKVVPSLPIHGSTQMSITSAEGVDFAAQHFGVERVVLGRELSVREMGQVGSVALANGIELEAFVHGALCVSYSGQCYSSEAWGGRSANRGQCAQACRMEYGLLVDGQLRQLGDMKYLLSPQDLMGVDYVKDMIEAGVSCFKIEGRLKGQEYVALTTALYRRAVDEAWEYIRQNEEGEARGNWFSGVGRQEDEALRQVFSRGQDGDYRGLTPGFLGGVQHQELVRGRAPRHRGVYCGTVYCLTKRGVVVQLGESALRRGDGVVFDAGNPDEKEEAGAIYGLFDSKGTSLEGPVHSRRVELRFARGQVNARNIQEGDLVWRTKSVSLEKQMKTRMNKLLKGSGIRQGEQSPKEAAQGSKVPVDMLVSGQLGDPVTVRVTDSTGREGVASAGMIEKASKSAWEEARVVEAVGSLGDTPYLVQELRVEMPLEDGLFFRVKDLKQARREAVGRLTAERCKHQRDEGVIDGVAVYPKLLGSVISSTGCSKTGKNTDGAPALNVLCRTREQVQAALQLDWLHEIVLDFLEVQGLKEACEEVRAAGKLVVVATPRVLKPEEHRLWRFYLTLNADALLVRSTGMLQVLLDIQTSQGNAKGSRAEELTIPELRGDFSLNAANALTIASLLRVGLTRITPTHDLNGNQLCDMAEDVGPDLAQKLEFIVHQHLPIFHTEHCVFCRFLSQGSSFKDCGHPCESNGIHLRDHQGSDHLVLADAGCRNTVFNAQAQSGATFMKRWGSSGVGHLRVELVDEPAALVQPLLENYRLVLTGKGSEMDLWRWLETVPDRNGNAQGVSLGSLEMKGEVKRDSMKKTAAQTKRAEAL